MKSNKIEVNFPKHNDTKLNITKRNITKERKKEILDQLENGLKTTNENKQTEPELPCPIACKTNLTYENFVDHMIECEKIIENCYKCGHEYMDNDVHRDRAIHSKAKQRFSCMDCMKAHATKLRIATNHRNICQESGTREVIENIETPEATGELFHEYYATDKIARKVLKEEF